MQTATHPLLTVLLSLPAAALFSGGVAALIYALRHTAKGLDPPGFGLLLLLEYALFIVFIVAFLLAGAGNGGAAAAEKLNQLSVQATWALAGLVTTLIAFALMLMQRAHQRAIGGALLFLPLFGIWVLVSVGNPRALFPLPSGVGQLGPLVGMPVFDLVVSLASAAGMGLLFRLKRLDRGALGYIIAVLVGVTILQGVNDLYSRQVAPTNLVTLSQVGLLIAALVDAAQRLVRTAKRRTVRFWASIGLVAGIAVLLGDAVLIALNVAHRLPSLPAIPEDDGCDGVLAIGLC